MKDQTRPSPLFRFLTDDSSIVLGGQCIATVLLKGYRERMTPIHTDLALSDKAVVGTVRKPLRVCRMAAGLHQYRQRTHAESGFSQTVRGRRRT